MDFADMESAFMFTCGASAIRLQSHIPDQSMAWVLAWHLGLRSLFGFDITTVSREPQYGLGNLLTALPSRRSTFWSRKLLPYIIIVGDAADIVCGAQIFMWSKLDIPVCGDFWDIFSKGGGF